jgi:hypothetical protein
MGPVLAPSVGAPPAGAVIPPIPAMALAPPLPGEQWSQLLWGGAGSGGLGEFADAMNRHGATLDDVADRVQGWGRGIDEQWVDGRQQAGANTIQHGKWLRDSATQARTVAAAAHDVAEVFDSAKYATPTPEEFGQARQWIAQAQAAGDPVALSAAASHFADLQADALRAAGGTYQPGVQAAVTTLGTPLQTAPPIAHGGGTIRAVDNHTIKQAPIPEPGPDPSVGGVPDPVTKLGLPNYNPESLSDEDVRGVYAQGKLRIIDLNDQLAREGVSAEDRAKIMYEQRNALRSWTRDISSNRAGAESLEASDPNWTWAQLVAKYQGQGFSGDDLYDRIIQGSTGSRASVDAVLGIDPKNPPPLPPVREAPIELPVEGPAPPAAPAEAPPLTEGIGGGLSADLPHFIPLPHSIHHLPILGEDDLDGPGEDYAP